MTEHLPGNPHCDDAATAGRYYAARSIHRDADVIALAQIEATLALAFEQRTANLIATMHVFDIYEETQDLQGDVLEQIVARLGLDGDA